jgi:hypothetical protein
MSSREDSMRNWGRFPTLVGALLLLAGAAGSRPAVTDRPDTPDSDLAVLDDSACGDAMTVAEDGDQAPLPEGASFVLAPQPACAAPIGPLLAPSSPPTGPPSDSRAPPPRRSHLEVPPS